MPRPRRTTAPVEEVVVVVAAEEPKRKRSKTAASASASATIAASTSSASTASATVAASTVTASPVLTWKQDLVKLLEIAKPEDPFDCQVKLGKDDRCDPDNIKTGMLLFRPAPILVLDAANGKVRNQELFQNKIDSDWSLGKDLFKKQCWSADHYTETIAVNKTQMAHKIKSEVGDSLCKVAFTKSPDANAMAQILAEGSKLIESSGATAEEKHKEYKKLWERIQKGEYRIMRGYIKRSEGEMDIQQTDTGMVKFEDADLKAKGEMADRMLNLNNVVELTLRLTKYVLK
jgi:hypothetical protein